MERVFEGAIGVVGCGVIGAGWATRALARGYEVVAHDPAPDAEKRLRSTVERAWPAMERLGLYPGADPDRITFVSDVGSVAERAEFVQESVPEALALKRAVHEAIDEVAPADVVIASSTSGLLPTEMQSSLRHPERLVVGHPFNPVYLLPLVEVVGGEETGRIALQIAEEFYRDLDMYPLRVRHEIDGFLSDRLQEALWRENLHLIADGVATTAELDAAITYGPGLRWALMGTNLTFHLAGGEEGMRHMLEQFGPALDWPWTKLVAPPLTGQLIDRLVRGTEEQADDRTIAELEELRDNTLIAIMEALEQWRIGAGEILAKRRQRIDGA